MVVGRPRIAAVDIGVPSIAVEDAVAGFVAGARIGTLMHRDGGRINILLLDLIEMVEGVVVGGIGGRGRGYDVEGSLTSLASGLAGLVSGGHGGMERGEVAHHALVLLLFIGMYGLSMLT